MSVISFRSACSRQRTEPFQTDSVSFVFMRNWLYTVLKKVFGFLQGFATNILDILLNV